MLVWLLLVGQTIESIESGHFFRVVMGMMMMIVMMSVMMIMM